MHNWIVAGVLYIPAAELRAGWLYAGVTCMDARAVFELTVTVALPPPAPLVGDAVLTEQPGVAAAAAAAPAAAGAGAAAAMADAAPGSVACDNCGQRVPAVTLQLHSAFCARHNTRCRVAGCGALLRRGDEASHVHCGACTHVARSPAAAAKHTRVAHTPVACSCGAALEPAALRLHRAGTCVRRLITCSFCGATVRAGEPPADHADRLAGLSGHESYCGSRTAACDYCRRPVQLKRMGVHVGTVHVGAGPPPPRPLEAAPSYAADGASFAEMDGAAAPDASAPAWVCAACTLSNAPEERVCGACGADRPGRGGGGGDGGGGAPDWVRGAVQPPGPPAVGARCGNEPCAARASQSVRGRPRRECDCARTPWGRGCRARRGSTACARGATTVS